MSSVQTDNTNDTTNPNLPTSVNVSGDGVTHITVMTSHDIK